MWTVCWGSFWMICCWQAVHETLYSFKARSNCCWMWDKLLVLRSDRCALRSHICILDEERSGIRKGIWPLRNFAAGNLPDLWGDWLAHISCRNWLFNWCICVHVCACYFWAGDGSRWPGPWLWRTSVDISWCLKLLFWCVCIKQTVCRQSVSEKSTRSTMFFLILCVLFDCLVRGQYVI